jgi:hypothetical protein
MKGKGKERMILNIFTSDNKQLGTIEDNHSKHTIEDQGCSWTTPLEKLFECCFFIGFHQASYIIN